jgi:hypothetical protein
MAFKIGAGANSKMDDASVMGNPSRVGSYKRTREMVQTCTLQSELDFAVGHFLQLARCTTGPRGWPCTEGACSRLQFKTQWKGEQFHVFCGPCQGNSTSH